MTVENLTGNQFQEKVFDYTSSKEWEYKGENPCIIDFYADWCGPCKMLGPLLEELSVEYHCNINFYKVDTGAEQELAGAFGIRSIPSLLFIPKDGKPQMSMGVLPKETFRQLIKEVFYLEKCL